MYELVIRDKLYSLVFSTSRLADTSLASPSVLLCLLEVSLVLEEFARFTALKGEDF